MGLFGKIFKTLGKVGGAAVGGLIGGPGGAAIGAKIGGKLGGAVGGAVEGGKNKGTTTASTASPTGVDFSGLMTPILGAEGSTRRGSESEIAVAPVASLEFSNPAYDLMRQWDQVLRLPDKDT